MFKMGTITIDSVVARIVFVYIHAAFLEPNTWKIMVKCVRERNWQVLEVLHEWLNVFNSVSFFKILEMGPKNKN